MAPTWHGDLPWRELLRAFRFVRRVAFTKARSDGEYLRTEATVEALRDKLGGVGYAPAWKYSYDVGEDLNLAWVYREGGEWRQCHVRAWDDGEYRYLSAHDELTPEEHPTAHLRGDGADRGVGMAELQPDLRILGIGFDRADW